MKKMLACLIVLFGIIGFPAFANAHGDEERIHDFATTVKISPENIAHVRETIVYDFGEEEHHGIYRDIPIDYKDGKTAYYLTARFENAVDEKGQQISAEKEEVDGNLRVRLGDENTTLTGIHTYIIDYSLSPVVMKKDNKPFLNLDMLGEGWAVPIDNFSASVSLENGAQLENVNWFGGGVNSKTGQVVVPHLQPYQAVTINAFLPDHYVANYLEPNKPRPFDVWVFLAEVWVLIVIVVSVIIGLGIVGWRWWRAWSKRKSQTVIPEYEPPKGMTPAEVGLLDDDTSAMREVTATVIDWAVRGYIKITRQEKKGWFGSVGYMLTQLKSGKDLPTIEKKLYEAFFAQGKEVTLKDLDKSKMATAVSEFQSKTKERLSDQGFYDKQGHLINRGTLTDTGARQWAKVEGFQMYLSVVEKDRLNFSDAPEKTPERFNELLPFAIALGVEKQWAKQFEGIDVSQATTWYAGNMVAFNAINIASDIGTSFASTVSSNAAVSSSGGSSGGGVGGGGGGSW